MVMKTKKELKEQYKQLKFKMGVYQLRNTVNGKILIGSSMNMDAIWNRLKAQLKFNAATNPALQSEWQTLGEDAFRFEILAEIKEKEGETIDYGKEIKELEQMYIEEFQPFGDKGYNR